MSAESEKTMSTVRKNLGALPPVYTDSFLRTGAFNVLTEMQKRVIALHFEEPRLSFSEMSRLLSLPMSTVVGIELKGIETLVYLEAEGYPNDPEDFLIGAESDKI